MCEPANHRLDAALRQPPGLWPFLPAGYPDLQTTADLLRGLDARMVRGVEIGFPFTDPIADGPVIQHAFHHAIARGVRVAEVFDMIRMVRTQTNLPLLAMVSASIIYRMGLTVFCQRAAEAGFDGLIVPDLPLEEASVLHQVASPAGMRLCMLVAPTTPPGRQRQIAHSTDGFLYYVSVQGITGSRDTLPADLTTRLGELRRVANRPVLVGFGLSTGRHVREVCRLADGAIVGSAIVGHMAKCLDQGLTERPLVERVIALIEELAVS